MGDPKKREWENEPNRIEYVESGIKALILRNPELGILCGYIALPLKHILAGKNYNNMPLIVHGGLTFGDKGDGNERDKGYFWYGFDCGHYKDFIPKIVETLELIEDCDPKHWYNDSIYRNVEYVKGEIKYIVGQLWRGIFQLIGMEVAIGAAVLFLLIVLAVSFE